MDRVPNGAGSLVGRSVSSSPGRSYKYVHFTIRVEKDGFFRRDRRGFHVDLLNAFPIEFEATLARNGVAMATLTKSVEVSRTIDVTADDNLVRTYDVLLLPTLFQSHSIHKVLKSVDNYR